MLRRPPDRAALHFYAICLLFFLMYSTSYTGKLNLADWTLLWTDNLAILFLPVVFLHFCLSFPERRLATRRGWLIPAAYMPALALAGAAVASQVLFVTTSRRRGAVARSPPPSTAGSRSTSPRCSRCPSAILLDSYRKTRSLTARKQMKWLVWGTGAGVLPFFLFYAIPFALGREPRLAMELAGYIPLALIPLSLAYAVVKHRLMDVELIFRRTLVYILATAAIVGICLLAVNLFQVIVRRRRGAARHHHGRASPRCSWSCSSRPVKSRIQEGIDRLFFRERYNSRRGAAAPLAGPERRPRPRRAWPSGCSTACTARWAWSSLAVFLPEDDGGFAIFQDARLPARGRRRARCPRTAPLVRAAGRGRAGQRGGRTAERCPRSRPLDLTLLLPLPREGRADRDPGRRPQGRARSPQQRGGRPAAGPGRPGRHRLHERPAVPQPAREGGRAAGAHRVQREHPGEHGLGHPGARPRTARSRAGTAPWRSCTAGGGTRCSAAPWTRSSRSRSWRRCAAAWCSAGRTRRSPTSTSCTCPAPTGAA